jgi:hypothetical protein
MFFGLQVDRGNLVQAVADNLLNDLHLSTNRTSESISVIAHLLTSFENTTLATQSSCSHSFSRNFLRNWSLRKSAQIDGFLCRLLYGL